MKRVISLFSLLMAAPLKALFAAVLLVSGAWASEEERTARTADGWTIALHRFKADSPRFLEPVLLTHGFIENRHVWDLEGGASLARELSARGFDVWTMELRGSGESEAPPISDVLGWRFSIDDFIRYDAPAAIETVLKETGASQVLMVGHSLGGLITYAVLEGPEAPKVRAAVTLAGAGTMSGGPALQLAFNRFFKILGLTIGPVLPENAPFAPGWMLRQTLGGNDGLWSQLGKRLASPLGEPFWSEGDVTPEQVTALLRHSVTDTGMNVVRQFLRYAKQGKVDRVTEGLSAITAPVLAIAGSEDHVIPASDVRFVAAQAKARYVEVPGAGHEDLCFGAKAGAAFPMIGAWLEEHATPLEARRRMKELSQMLLKVPQHPFLGVPEIEHRP